MSKRLIVLGVIVTLLGGWSRQGNALANESGDQTKAARFQGKVVGAYDNEILVLQHETGYIVVRTGKPFYDLGIAVGDEIAVSGTISREKVVKGVLVADKVQKIAAGTQKEEDLRLSSIRDVQYEKREGRLVAIRAEITAVTPRDLTVSHAGVSLPVRLWPNHGVKITWRGRDVVVIGTVTPSPVGNTIEPVEIIPAILFRREGEPQEAQRIQEILAQRPVGKVVKAERRLALFFGQESATVLYEGKDVLIVRRAEKYLSLDTEAGGLVHVVGVFDYETQRGRQYGVLKDARIDPPDVKVTKP